MKIRIEIDKAALTQLVVDHICNKLGDITIMSSDVTIEVKSQQNYKSVWEVADFRAIYETNKQ